MDNLAQRHKQNVLKLNLKRLEDEAKNNLRKSKKNPFVILEDSEDSEKGFNLNFYEENKEKENDVKKLRRTFSYNGNNKSFLQKNQNKTGNHQRWEEKEKKLYHYVKNNFSSFS